MLTNWGKSRVGLGVEIRGVARFTSRVKLLRVRSQVRGFQHIWPFGWWNSVRNRDIANTRLLLKKNFRGHNSAQIIFKQGETEMGDKGSKDKGKREQQKKAQRTPKEKRKSKKEKKNKSTTTLPKSWAILLAMIAYLILCFGRSQQLCSFFLLEFD